MEGKGGRRMPALPEGWYPGTKEEIAEILSAWVDEAWPRTAVSVISPHAGWRYSGRLAAKAIATLRKSQTIAVFGGHLGYADTILCARDSAFQTPSGDLETDIELLAALESELRDSGYGSLREDVRTDNSVEVLLPMLPILHPGAKILWLRSPPRPVAKEVGAALGRAAAVLGRSVSCIGSTDLTHYGPAYGFTPQGTDSKAVRWVRETNDASFISALLDMNCETALSMGIRKGSACSPGAAVSALSFALESGATSSRLIEYSTSLEVVASPSFVGYAAMSFEP